MSFTTSSAGVLVSKSSLLFRALLFRRAWDDISGKIGASFKVSEYAVKLSEEVLRKAKSFHDILVGKKREADDNWNSSANKKAYIVSHILIWHSN